MTGRQHKHSTTSKRTVVLTVPKGTRVKVKRKKTSSNPIVVQTGRTRVAAGLRGGKGWQKWLPKVVVKRVPKRGE